jgi:aryl-alcohol dehydrogenase-like predicted oxidoreductase
LRATFTAVDRRLNGGDALIVRRFAVCRHGANEMLVGRATKGRRDKVHISVKFGALLGPDGAFIGFDVRPQLVKAFAAYSVKRLRIEVIDIYRSGRLDPNIPIEET